MTRARSSSPNVSEESEDVFDDSFEIAAFPSRSLSLSNPASRKFHEQLDLSNSFDSEVLLEPYQRRGSSARCEKRKPSMKSESYVEFAEVLSHFQNQDPMRMQKFLDEQNAKQGNAKILGIFSPHPKLPNHLQNEKDIFLMISETKYDRSEPIHLLILQSIYSRLMGGPLTCPALGAHWIDVGFNHTDPSIDLSSPKMIGAVCLLYFITQYPLLAEEVFHTSTSHVKGFPFALLGLTFSKSVVKLVRKESLNRQFIRQKQLIYIVMDLYCSMWFKFSQAWKTASSPDELSRISTLLEHEVTGKPLSYLVQFQKVHLRGGSTQLRKPSIIHRGLKLSSSVANIRASLKSVS